jgi:DNA/RNA-binding domain of Phe-tRNA-synthetase-like protein
MAVEIKLAPEMVGRVRLGTVVLRGVRVASSHADLEAEVKALGDSLRKKYVGALSSQVPGVEAARGLYKSLGIDPTKTRPSNEALLRRVLKGEALYRVNLLVDSLNFCSLRQQLPYGLYDLDQVSPPILLRFGLPGEAYEGIRKGEVHVAGRPVLVDLLGPFGNPTSDSARTQIRDGTQNALTVLYAPSSLRPAGVEEALSETAATLVRFCGGEAGELLVTPR